MILSVLLLALTVAIAYYHYTQGLFSATISAILVTIAAVAAVGFHENVAAWMIGGKYTELASATALCLILGVTYTAGRFIFDFLVPGNVRFPVLVDKIGAAAVGLWAGLIATGVIAIAAQTLPFGPDVGYYSRYSIKDVSGQYMGAGQNQDVTMFDMTNSPTLNPDDENHLLLRQDDLVMGLMYKLSDGGSLAGEQQLEEVHPDYLSELFGQRIGIQLGAQHALVALPAESVSVSGVYTQPQFVQIDGEIPSLRPTDEQVQPVLQPPDRDQQALLIVRMVVPTSKDAADSDGFFRFSAGSVRLVAGHSDESGTEFTDYHPVATLDRRGVAVACRIDDFLIAPLSGARTIDLIFIVDKSSLLPTESRGAVYQLAPGTFLEVKRYTILDLSGKKVEYGPPTNKDKMGLIRKPDVDKMLVSLGPQTMVGVAPPTPPQPGASTGDLGLIYQDLSVAYSIFTPIDARKTGDSGRVQLPSGVSGSWEQGGWTSLSIPMEELVSVVAPPTGTNLIDHFAPAEDNVMVQFHMTAPRDVGGKKAWDWGKRMNDLTLADTQEMTYKPIGVWARAQSKLQDYIVASVANNGNSFFPIAVQAGKAKPTDVWIAFLVPPGTKLQELRLSDTAVLEDLGFKAEAPPPPPPATVPSASSPAGSGAGQQ